MNTKHIIYVCLVVGALLFLVSSPVNANAASGLTVFGSTEVRSSDLKPFPKWTGTLSRYFDQKKLAERNCGLEKFNPCALRAWEEKVDSLQDKNTLAQLREVNRYLNKVRYVLDPINWGVPDYGSTPNEFFAVDGDCEDYAIAKFISLRALGIPNEDMRIMVVQDMNLGGIIHSVLAVRLNGQVYILDNQIPKLEKATRIHHYRPIYSINEGSWWRH